MPAEKENNTGNNTGKPRVAIMGTKASFHEEAAFRFFGRDIQTVECGSFGATFRAVKEKRADYMVMAIENSIAGSILPNYSLLMEYRFGIAGEVYLPIRLHLMALPGVKMQDLRTVISHPIALRQCVDFFDLWPGLKIQEGSDTADCARRIRDEHLTDTAAVAGTLSAETYGLDILESRIESGKKNYTRFLILSESSEALNPGPNFSHTDLRPDKASLSFRVGDEIGSLARVLNILAAKDINLSKIQSMPVPGSPHEYNFYADIDWESPGRFDAAMPELIRQTRNFNILGEYLKNDTI
ncbi:MAG: prephenate dehydratase [Bacteroidota bacterium]